MVISRKYVTFRKLLDSGDEAGIFFMEKLHESYPKDMWNGVWNTLADQCLYQKEMGWAFTKIGDVIKKFTELDRTLPYDDGKFDSWEIIDETTAIKCCDKSFFEYNESGIPKEICWFFDIEDFNSGESREISLIYNGVAHIGKLRNDVLQRVKISWNSELSKFFSPLKKFQIDCTI